MSLYDAYTKKTRFSFIVAFKILPKVKVVKSFPVIPFFSFFLQYRPQTSFLWQACSHAHMSSCFFHLLPLLAITANRKKIHIYAKSRFILSSIINSCIPDYRFLLLQFFLGFKLKLIHRGENYVYISVIFCLIVWCFIIV